ncbi:MAG: lysozyme [Alteraurantiacibacter sp.]
MDSTALLDFLGRIFPGPVRPPEACDAAVENLPQDSVRPVRPSDLTLPGKRQIGPLGINLIKRFEGCARRRKDGMVAAYPDPGTGGEPWTIGWGATGPDGAGGRIGPHTVWTKEQCDARLEADLVRYAKAVDRALDDAPTTQAQFDALTSFHYNTGAIAQATLTRLHKAGDQAGAARQFERWVNAGGRVMKGLVRRRADEASLYRGKV